MTEITREMLDACVERGEMEVVDYDEEGEPRFRLTDKGQEMARALYEKHGVDPDEPDPDAENLKVLLTRIDAEEQAGTS